MRWPFARPVVVTPEPTVPLALYTDLLAKYHALATQPREMAAPDVLFQPPPNPMDALGPLTKAALSEMSLGLSSAHRRAMEQRALSLAVSVKEDEKLAAAIRKGEPVQWIPV